MIEKEKIPEPLQKELFYLFGEERTERIVKRVGYNFYALVLIVTDEKLKIKFGFRILPLIGIILIIVFLIGLIFKTTF